MLVEYQVANFGPYKQPISLNMKSTEDDSFCGRIPRFESPYHMSVNPVAAIYGPNSSGKSIIFWVIIPISFYDSGRQANDLATTMYFCSRSIYARWTNIIQVGFYAWRKNVFIFFSYS